MNLLRRAVSNNGYDPSPSQVRREVEELANGLARQDRPNTIDHLETSGKCIRRGLISVSSVMMMGVLKSGSLAVTVAVLVIIPLVAEATITWTTT